LATTFIFDLADCGAATLGWLLRFFD